MRVCLVVDVHQLANGSVGVLLRGGERLMAEKLLDGAKIGAIGKEMCGERVTQRMWVQIPIDVGDAHIFFDDASDGALRKPAP